MNVGAARALAFAVRHLNASARDPIDEASLLDALRSDEPPARYRHHVRDFLDETELETLSDLVRSGAITYARLAHHAGRDLAADHETRTWLDDRA